MIRKLDKEHLDEIQSLQEAFARNTNVLGTIAIETYAVTQQLTQLEAEQAKYLEEFEKLRSTESALIEKMRERYGEGQINIAQGTFTPDSGLTQ